MLYKEETRKQITKLLTDFFTEERGNRVTGFNFSTLLQIMNQIFDKNEVENKISNKH